MAKTNSSGAKKEIQGDEETRQQALFNSVTNSVSPENQNQNHNTKKQALGPNTKR
ncbi:MAG TPA: hypothetical protein VHO94_04635 [Oscillospiraceae bacterium]|nr:hypothetical protein [Oscillospiraceae bacterium]